jgi:hypothetical protein
VEASLGFGKLVLMYTQTELKSLKKSKESESYEFILRHFHKICPKMKKKTLFKVFLNSVY